MKPPGSVTGWIGSIKAGEEPGRDELAAQQLWERFFRRLVGLARTKLQDHRRRAADEEDVALSAFDSFFRGAERGQFPALQDRNDLWRLLVTITVRKAHDHIRDANRQKRGGGRVVGESAVKKRGGRMEADEGDGLEQFIDETPTPALAAQLAEECRRLLDLLTNDDLQRVALLRMEGFSNEQIAEQLGCVTRTVERRLSLIRKKWEQANDDDPA